MNMHASTGTRTALRALTLLVATSLLSACERPVARQKDPSPALTEMASVNASPFKIKASIQELMEAIVDPSADGVWDSVGTTVTPKGLIEHQPQTDAEWQQVRLHGVALIEATNLLMMEGRRLVPDGGKIADEGSDGVLTTAAAEQMLKTERATFVQFASALNDAAVQMLNAIDAKKPQAMMEAGETLDEICESCHMKFWYPNQAVWQISKGMSGDVPKSTRSK